MIPPLRDRRLLARAGAVRFGGIVLLIVGATACSGRASTRPSLEDPPRDGPYAVVLGIAQDAGYPQAGMKESPAWEDPSLRRMAACLGIVDRASAALPA